MISRPTAKDKKKQSLKENMLLVSYCTGLLPPHPQPPRGGLILKTYLPSPLTVSVSVPNTFVQITQITSVSLSTNLSPTEMINPYWQEFVVCIREQESLLIKCVFVHFTHWTHCESCEVSEQQMNSFGFSLQWNKAGSVCSEGTPVRCTTLGALYLSGLNLQKKKNNLFLLPDDRAASTSNTVGTFFRQIRLEMMFYYSWLWRMTQSLFAVKFNTVLKWQRYVWSQTNTLVSFMNRGQQRGSD